VVAAATALAVTETPPSGEYVWVEAVSGTFALTPAGKTVGLGTLYFTGLQGTTPQLWTQTSLTQSASASDRYLEGLRGSTAGGAVSFVSVANTNTPAVAGMMTGFTSTSDTFPPAGICPLDVSGTSSGGTVEVAQISGGALTTIQTVWSGMAVGFSLVAFFLAALFFVSLRRR
jgi:hypothetical protein